MSIRVFVCGFYKETYGAKSVVARNHRGLFVFHPAVKEVHATVGERHDEGGENLPGAVAETFWLLPAVCDKNGSFLQVACVLDGVLVLFHEVLVASLANDCNLDFFHRVKDRFFLGMKKATIRLESAMRLNFLLERGILWREVKYDYG